MDELIDFLVEHSESGQWTKEEARRFFESELPKLDHWRDAK
ncbi:MAG: zinc ribbon domain-containing protein [Clostridia bacterium]|nr:zinc ribbon domain-containing protein [Clostridia bacterium]